MFKNIVLLFLSFFLSFLPGNPPGLKGHDSVVEHVQEGEVTAEAIRLIFHIKNIGV